MTWFANKRVPNWIWIALIAIVAIGLRLYAIDRLPPGLFGDEAVEGLDALDVLAGNLGIWFHAHLGREPIYVYLVALAYQWFGVTPLATRLPAIMAGLLTIPATYFFAREFALAIVDRARAQRIARLTTALIAVSFWHIQMTRDAHRDTLLPLVEALGYGLLWRAMRTRDWRAYAGAGAILGLAVYTYSPGRFVGVFVALFVVIELIIQKLTTDRRPPIAKHSLSMFNDWQVVTRLALAALFALLVMLPLGIYFAQNPVQFSRRFESVMVFDAPSPLAALGESVVGNLAQFVVPDAGYQSKHYNLPGKPIFDLLLAPWFLAGLVLAFARIKHAPYRFLLLWFFVMLTPAFLTHDMIPKAVRGLGVVPGVFVFIALAMDGLIARARGRIAVALVALTFIGSTIWTTYDYFVAWANLPELPQSFDADMTELAGYLQQQPAQPGIVISQQVYRPPTLMLLGERVPTTRYVDRATHIQEADAHTTLIADPNATYIFVHDFAPPDEWLARIAPNTSEIARGVYFTAHRLGPITPPQKSLALQFNPLLKLIGVSRYADDPRGAALYWQVTQLPADRADIQSVMQVTNAAGASVTQGKQTFGVPPLEWKLGDTIVEWYALDDLSDDAAQFTIRLTRGTDQWQSPTISLR